MRSRSRTVSRRRRTLPASDTAIAAGCASSAATTRLTAGSAVASRRRSSGASPTPASSAFRIFSSLFAPMPDRSRSRPDSAAAFRPSSDVMPSCVQIRAAVFGPTPGSRRKSTTPAGTSPRRFVSACISPSSTTSTTFASIVFPIPGSVLRLAVERELRDRHGSLADPPRRAPVRDDLERLLLQDLREIGQEVELVRELAVPRQRLGHPAMIRRCLGPSSASRRTTSGRTSSRWWRRSAASSTRPRTASSSSTTARPTAPERSPTGSPPSCRGSPCCTARRRRASAPPTSRASAGRSQSGAELVLEMDCDFSHDPADVPRLIAAAEDADLVLGSRYVAGRRHRELGASAPDRLARGLPLRAGDPRPRRARPHGRLQVLPPRRARGDRPRMRSPRTATRSRSRRRTASSAPGCGCWRCRSRFVERRAGASKMTGAIVAEAMWRVPVLRLRALVGKL